MSKTGSGTTSPTGGRADPSESNPCWRLHQRTPRSYKRCAVCDVRAWLRVRRQSGDLEVRCVEHFMDLMNCSRKTALQARKDANDRQ